MTPAMRRRMSTPSASQSSVSTPAGTEVSASSAVCSVNELRCASTLATQTSAVLSSSAGAGASEAT
ncbi:Uncharacterised protein [Mycobacteroides abscessus subsp. abscessus]|nr:Uncharacterised protein [Mycobacteroides abscessus subsp. abscessus]